MPLALPILPFPALEEALPVLQRYGMTATVFLTVGPRGPRTPAARLPALTGSYGRADARTRALVREHFACACSDQLGLVAPRSDPYALERVDAYYLRTERLFALLLTRVFPWYLMARSIPRWLRRAVSLGVLRPR